jgi:hypothetical protein
MIAINILLLGSLRNLPLSLASCACLSTASTSINFSRSKPVSYLELSNVITTRNFQDRLDTLESVQNADINVCSGGILGLGEGQTDRASMLRSLANLEKHPGSAIGLENCVW